MIRLFVPPERLAAGALAIDGDDHHYLFRVRRLARGHELVLLDGAGRQAAARVEQVGPRSALLRVDEPGPAPASARPRLSVLLALIKGERMEWAIQKLTELGVDELVPVQAERSVVLLAGERAETRRARYAAVARSAAQQCGRRDVPHIAAAGPLSAALAGVAPEALRLVLWEQARGISLRAALPGAPPPAIALLVGPEGGLSAAEVDGAVAAGFSPVGLGPRILRAETAAVAAVAALGFALGDLG